MMSKRRLLSIPSLALLALAVACGGDDDKKIEIEKPTMGDPAAYFGVEACTCYEYETTDGSDSRTLGVAVERVDDFYSDVVGKDVHTIVYRLGGAVQATYVVDPTNPDLLLTRVQSVTSGDEWRLSPGMSLSHWLGDRSSMVSTKVSATRYQNATPVDEPQELEIRTLIEGTTSPIRASLDGGATEEDYDATLIQYTQTPWKEPKRWFVPEIGNVQVEYRGARWILRNKRILEGGCPGAGVTDICGAKAP